MRVVLAYAHLEHAAEETVELDDVTARRLLREGKARRAPEPDAPADPPPPPPLEELDARQLRARARELGVDLGGARKKSEILALLESASQARETEPDAPANADDDQGANR